MPLQIFRRSRRVLLLGLASMALGTSAQTWPDRPIKLVVPFPPGGGADTAARMYGEKLSALLGQPVMIDNKPGASGNIGAELVARAPADGYTLLFANEFLATNPLMFKEIRYDSLKDFVPIAKVASNAAAIAVHPSLGIKTIQELMALGRTKNLNYASPGIGTGPHLFGQLIALQTGAKFTLTRGRLRPRRMQWADRWTSSSPPCRPWCRTSIQAGCAAWPSLVANAHRKHPMCRR